MSLDRRNEIAWAIQGLMAKFIPDDYEDVWPSRFSFAMADALINGHPVLDKALALPPPTVAVGEVRALEWDGLRASSVAGNYYVEAKDGKAWTWYLYARSSIVGYVFPALYDAQAAAQADYEARIRSALVTNPAEA